MQYHNRFSSSNVILSKDGQAIARLNEGPMHS